jgi:hypothetical protein
LVSRGGFLAVVCGVREPYETGAGGSKVTSPLSCSALLFNWIATPVGFAALAVAGHGGWNLDFVLLAAAVMPVGVIELENAVESLATLARTTVICANRRTVKAFSFVARDVA